MLKRSEIREDLLTLEDAALLADPDGQVPKETLDRVGAMLARQAGEPDRYRAIERKLQRAWSDEQARNQPAEDFAARLCEVQPEEAERLLRLVALRYQARRRLAAKPGREVTP